MRRALVLVLLLPVALPTAAASGDCSEYAGPDDAISERLPTILRPYGIRSNCMPDGTQSESITVFGIGGEIFLTIRTTHTSEGDTTTIRIDEYYAPWMHHRISWTDDECDAHLQTYYVDEDIECVPPPVMIFGRWDDYPAEARTIAELLP